MPALRLARLLLVPALLAGCSLQPAPRHPRPALPLPLDLGQRFALPGPVEEELAIALDDHADVLRVRLRSGDETSELHFWRAAEDGAPLVLLLPILAGGRQLMWLLASDLHARGYAVAWSRRTASALQPGQRGPEMETLLLRTVIHNRMALCWLRRQNAVDPDRIGVLGVSMGGMLGALLLAVEPDLRGAALCLAGADLPEIAVHSQEPRVVRWRQWRAEEDGIGASGIREELRLYLRSDPARLAPYVPTDRVFLVATDFDDVVPEANQDLLWEALGRPRRISVPLGHYTAALGLGWLLDLVDAFLRQRMESAGRSGQSGRMARPCT